VRAQSSRGGAKGQLRLYVTGETLLSVRAIENLQWFMSEGLGDLYAYEVIDVLERPDLAEEDGIFATPALVRRWPRPVRKLIGDLSNRELVLSSLRLDALPGKGAS
jgi:circadian clock protein KaiB